MKSTARNMGIAKRAYLVLCNQRVLCSIVFFSFLLLLSPAFSFADSDFADFGRPPIRVFTDKDGLPQNTIQAMAVDRNNYLWIATQDGAAYYNGRKWNVVNMPNRTISNDVRAMIAASDGGMWFGTFGGGASNYKDGKWITYDLNSGLPHNRVRCLLETFSDYGKQIIWIGTNEGLAKLENGKWTIYDKSVGLPDNQVTRLLETRSPEGRRILWVGTREGLAKFENDKWTVYDINSGLPNNIVRSMLETISPNGSHSLWVGTNKGLAEFEDGKWTIYSARSEIPGDEVTSIIETAPASGDRALWIGTNNGLAKWQNAKWSIYDAGSGLPTNSVWSLIAVGEANGPQAIWIGTNIGLANLQPGRWIAFDMKRLVPNHAVWAIRESISENGAHALWVATDGSGLAKLENGKWTIYDKTSGLPHNVVRSLLVTSSKDGNQIIWAGTFGGLAKLENGKWTIYDTSNGLPDNGVISLYESIMPNGSSVIWAGTFNGLAKFEDGRWIKYDKSSGLPENGIWSLGETVWENGKRTLWVGTSGGLARFEDGKWTSYDMRSGLPNISIWSILDSRTADGKHLLWIGTNGGGLCRTDLSERELKFKIFNEATVPALPNNVVYQIREDSKKRLYIFTVKGVARFASRTPTNDDPSEYASYIFTTEDGLPSNECNHGAAMIDRLGRIWTGTISGAAMFDPSQEKEDRLRKPLEIERILLAGKNRAFQQNDSLAYNENNIAFEYALLSYFRESETRYRTQLIGLDKKPSVWTNDYNREYNYLPEGNYVFKVWAKDYAGNITGPKEIAFKIMPAPWRTWWAYLLYAAASGAILYGIVLLRLQRLRRRNQLLEAKIAERTAELAKKNEELAKKNTELIQSRDELIESYKKADLMFSALSEALPGSVLEDKYRIESKIGAGGFGAVYRAVHISLNRPVAVKIFRPASGNATAESLARFRLEGISTCRVNHPNAVSVLDSGVSAAGIPYLVMELLEGHTLSAELKKRGKLSPERAAEILIPVCEALTKAHSAGIIHRDIKPDNIFLHQTPEGEVVKVVDFGIAKLMSEDSSLELPSLTAGGGMIGTPIYMSPERLANEPYDGKADVYSLGVTLYQMLCGRAPFKSEEGNFWIVVAQHLKDSPPSLKRFNPNIPSEVETTVMRALSKNPSMRQTAKELAKDFAAALGIELTERSSGGFRFAADNQSATGQVTGDLIVQKTEAVIGPDDETIDAEILNAEEATKRFPDQR